MLLMATFRVKWVLGQRVPYGAKLHMRDTKSPIFSKVKT
jgi:hypothetical protein